MIRYNQQAFDAAKMAGGLVLYYQGELLPVTADVPKPSLGLDFTPDCLSFCIWQSLAQARAGSGVANHRRAAARSGEWYERFAIKKYRASARGAEVLLEEVVTVG